MNAIYLYICESFSESMDDDKRKLLNDLEFRVRQLMYLCDTLGDENSRLKSNLQEKTKEAENLAEEMEQLKHKYDSLKLARTITAATVDVETAKEKLSNLVREVDRCITLLT